MITYAIKDLEVGKTYWLCEPYGNTEFKVISAPQLTNEEIDRWECQVEYYQSKGNISGSKFFDLSISDEPKYIRVKTIHLDGRVDFNDGDFLNKKGKKHEQVTTGN